MLEFNDKDVIEKLTQKDNWSISDASAAVKTLANLDSRLQTPLDAWLAGQEADAFAFDGVSLRKIMKTEALTLIEAFYRMHKLMNDIDQIEKFKAAMNKPYIE